jgi:hypothetical protein
MVSHSDPLDPAATPEEIERLLKELPAKGKRPRQSHLFDRDNNDYYVEPPWCSGRLFAVELFARLIWDPAAGSGTIPRAARAAGLSYFASDIVDHGCGPRQDFLISSAPAEAFNVVTNPPFQLARAFVERALTLGAVKTAIIFPTARLNAARWLKPLPLAKILLLTPRPSMPPGEIIARGEKPSGGKTDFCWLVLNRTHSGPSELWWLHRDDPRKRL